MSEDPTFTVEEYADRNHKLWRLISLIDPKLSGNVDESYEKALKILQEFRKDTERLSINELLTYKSIGYIPEKENRCG